MCANFSCSGAKVAKPDDNRSAELKQSQRIFFSISTFVILKILLSFYYLQFVMENPKGALICLSLRSFFMNCVGFLHMLSVRPQSKKKNHPRKSPHGSRNHSPKHATSKVNSFTFADSRRSHQIVKDLTQEEVDQRRKSLAKHRNSMPIPTKDMRRVSSQLQLQKSLLETTIEEIRKKSLKEVKEEFIAIINSERSSPKHNRIAQIQNEELGTTSGVTPTLTRINSQSSVSNSAPNKSSPISSSDPDILSQMPRQSRLRISTGTDDFGLGPSSAEEEEKPTEEIKVQKTLRDRIIKRLSEGGDSARPRNDDDSDSVPTPITPELDLLQLAKKSAKEKDKDKQD
jgi:hypothetical protein